MGHEQLNRNLCIFPKSAPELEVNIIGSCSSLIINLDEYDDRHTRIIIILPMIIHLAIIYTE